MATLAAVAAAVVVSSADGAPVRADGPTAHHKPVRVQPGSYSGTDVKGDALAFFVAPGGRSILNVAVPTVAFSCTPTASQSEASYADGSVGHPLTVPHLTIRRNGSFTAKVSEIGVQRDVVAKFTYAFSGRFGAPDATGKPTASGSLRENITFVDTAGTAHRCTSNNRSWKAAKSGPIPRRSLVTAGGYSATDASGDAITFSVTPGRRSIVNVSVPTIAFGCAPRSPMSEASYADGSLGTPLSIAQMTVGRNGSFTAKASESGVLRDVPATFTYFFSGSFQGLNASGQGSAAGLLREDVSFTDKDGTKHQCTTNNRPWTAARSS